MKRMSDFDDLPWGSWFRLDPRPRHDTVLVDPETGREWADIREAFWVGRMKGELEYGGVPRDKLELLHAALAAVVRRDLHEASVIDDLFRGNSAFAGWYVHWLRSEGLIKRKGSGREAITPEGLSVMRMLAVTRPGACGDGSGEPDVQDLSELGLGPETRESRLTRLERKAAQWAVAFLRRRIGLKHAVVLSRRGSGPIPIHQVAWTLAFDDEDRRDAFYDWLCARLDRWPAWCDLLRGDSATYLTHHLLLVMAGSLAGDDREAEPPTGFGCPVRT